MKYKSSILTGVAALGLLAAATKTTQAGSLSFGITLGGCIPHVVVRAPPRVVVHAPPPALVYHAPRPVVCQPAPPVFYPHHGHPNHYYKHPREVYHHQLKHLRKGHGHGHGHVAYYPAPVAHRGHY